MTDPRTAANRLFAWAASDARPIDEYGWRTVGEAIADVIREARAAGLREPLRPDPDTVARWFHEAYERLAPDYGYQTREASAVPWEDVPAGNRDLMRATAADVLRRLRALATEGEPQRPQFPTATTLTVDEVEVAPVTEGEPPPPVPLDVERLAWAIYLRCGDRDITEAATDAAAISGWLAGGFPVPADKLEAIRACLARTAPGTPEPRS